MNFFWLRKLPILILCLFLAVNNVGWAQEQPWVQLREAPIAILSPGDTREVAIILMISEGYHIQSAQPSDENLIASELYVESVPEFIPGEPEFPPAQEFRMVGMEEAWAVYDGVVEIKLPIRAATSVPAGSYTISATLHYQACDSIKCYFPRDLDFSIDLRVK
jgi:hypothetical protein